MYDKTGGTAYLCAGRNPIPMPNVVISTDIIRCLGEAIADIDHDRLFVLCDTTTRRLCLPLVTPLRDVAEASCIVIPPADAHKSLETLCQVWTALQQGGATRHSLLVNVGGGMVTDLGGFAASTFKRGIPYINVPTTLLAMVDASVGGKTGINYGGLKNEIGVFSDPRVVLIDTAFLATLDHDGICSGYAEMIKHGLISHADHLRELLAWPLDDVTPEALQTLSHLVRTSVAVKERIVTEDPLEHGLRKALNLGHTVGHAFESLALRGTCLPPAGRSAEGGMLHGYAVAYGLVCELYLACVKTGFPTSVMRSVAQFIREHYGHLPITCNDYPTLIDLMRHDKKNTAGTINFTLLAGVGDLRINQTATVEEIHEMLDFYREGS